MRAAPEWAHARIVGTEDIATDVREIRVAPLGGFAPSDLGSHLTVEVPIGDLVRTRSYSVVEDRVGAWTIAVRRLADSRGGSRFMWSLAPGDRVRVLSPESHFSLSPGSPDYLLIAGGIGITPMVGMARTLARHSKARLLYAGRSRAHMPYLDHLTGLLGERLQVFCDIEGNRIDFAQAFGELHAEGEAYVCGPAPMLAAARQAWQAAGRPVALLRFETFGSGGLREADAYTVHVRDHGVSLQVPRDASLLDTLACAGIDVAQDCLRGECGLCAVSVIGPAEIDHRDVFLSAGQRADGHLICACVSRAAGEITIDTGFRPRLARVHSTGPAA